MPVTDEQVAVLRALLTGQRERHRELLSKIDQAAANVGYPALLAAGFFEAVERRFIVDGTIMDDTAVIDFVASVRERTDETPDLIKPDIAERMILHALDKGASISNIDTDIVIQHQLVLLAALIGDAHLSEPELDAFLHKSRVDADELID
ncbi:hypothetical protein E1293_28785 [Actinomadura darangshiensis]|uniref:Uncharacterized protein n=1 Tax=Actinomadura darangshiensis TaxID=705336 RepID=A0A4R5AQX4_9ACTN|nr:hypothetical protein [Actinomadura darangshiensis]TDD75093.1 hypothetical protein E1293_28785 [Actinomadura darangshiensis]